jgi:hypothetical protein
VQPCADASDHARPRALLVGERLGDRLADFSLLSDPVLSRLGFERATTSGTLRGE